MVVSCAEAVLAGILILVSALVFYSLADGHRLSYTCVAVPFIIVASFLLHSELRQVTQCSLVLSSLGLTLLKFDFGQFDDVFLIHSSAAATVPNISCAFVRSWCIQFVC